MNYLQLGSRGVIYSLMTAATLPAANPGQHRPLRLPPVSGWSAESPSVHPAVARIIVPDAGGVSYGSGTLVDARGEFGLVVTNWHVVRETAGQIDVVFPGGFRSSARALKIDRDWDLAALVIWRPDVTPVPISPVAPKPGDVLTIAGFGQGDFRAASGRCTQYLAPGMNFPYEMVEINVEARQGDSGGPIFNERGELAGVLFGAGRGTTSGSYAGRVRGFLASIAPELAQPGGAMIAQRPPSSHPQIPQETTRGGSPADPQDRTEIAPLPQTQAESQVAIVEGDLEFKPQNSVQQELARVHPRPTLYGNPPRRIAPLSQPQFEPKAAALTALPDNKETAAPTVTWQRFAGESTFEQAKTALALLGAISVMLWVIRLGR